MSPLDPKKPASPTRPLTYAPEPAPVGGARALPGSVVAATPDQAGAAAAGSVPTVGALLASLRRRWLPALALGLLGAAAAVAAVRFFLPARYQASALLHVASR